MNKNFHDVAIVGSSLSGLSAALFLGNALRSVALIGDDNSRNNGAEHVHNLLGLENINPEELLQKSRHEVSQQQTVNSYATKVKSISKLNLNHFILELDNGQQLKSKVVVLATGVVDCLPSIPGIEKFWPKNIFHCPYCIAPELSNKPLAVLSDNEESFFLTSIVCKWTSDLILLTNGANLLSQSQRQRLMKKNIQICNNKIVSLSGTPGENVAIHFSDRGKISRRGIFIHLPFQQAANHLIEELGCSLTDNNLVQVDDFFQTSIPGVYAIGDMSQSVQKVATAIASGTVAGFAIDHALTETE